MALKELQVKHAKPQDRPYKLYDEKGLLLLVHPNGSRYWRVRYRFEGKEKTLSLGVYPEVSLIEARELRDRARKDLRTGVDPTKAKHEKKRLAVLRANNQFEAIAREWYSKREGRWTSRHSENVIRSLERDIFPAIGRLPIDEITARTMLDALEPIEKRGALDVVRRVNQRCSEVFNYALRTERCQNNPCAGLVKTFASKKVKHRPALSEKRLPDFLAHLEYYSGSRLVQTAMKLLVMTFVRPGELRGAEWKEFDLDKAEWRIPAHRMKSRCEHIVPLSTQAVALIREIHNISGKFELLFPGIKDVGKPISDVTLLKVIKILGYQGEVVPHGFRATASTILNENSFGADVIERQLAHVEQNKVRAAYHRAEYLAERRRMMQWWSDYLSEAKNKGMAANGTPKAKRVA